MVEEIKIKIDARELQNLLKIKGTAGALGGGGQEQAKQKSFFDKLLGKNTKEVAKGFVVANAFLGTIKKLGQKLVEASPLLVASLNILKKSVLLALKPIGDIMGQFLRPFAIAFLQHALQFYKWWNKNRDGILKGLTAGVQNVKETIKEIITGALPGATRSVTDPETGEVTKVEISPLEVLVEALSNLWTSLKEISRSLLDAFTILWQGLQPIVAFFGGAAFFALLGALTALAIALNIASGIIQLVVLGLQTIGGFGVVVFEQILVFWGKIRAVWEDITSGASLLLEEFKKKFDAIKKLPFVAFIWNSIRKIWNWKFNFNRWFWEKLKTVWNWTFDFGAWLKEKVTSIFGSFLPGGETTDTEDTARRNPFLRDFIMKPDGQLIKFDPQDTIMGFKSGPSGGGNAGVGAMNFTSNITINAAISSDQDIEELARKLSAIQQREFRSRTALGFGSGF